MTDFKGKPIEILNLPLSNRELVERIYSSNIEPSLLAFIEEAIAKRLDISSSIVHAYRRPSIGMKGRTLLVWAELSDLLCLGSQWVEGTTKLQALKSLAELAVEEEIGWSSWVPSYLLACCYLANIIGEYHKVDGGCEFPNLFMALQISGIPQVASNEAKTEQAIYETAAIHLKRAFHALTKAGLRNLMELPQEDHAIALRLQDELVREMIKTFGKLQRIDECLQAIQFQKGCSLLYQVIQNSGMRGNDTFSSYQNLMQLSPKELQGRLGPGDALIEFYIYEIVQDTAAIVTVENESLSLMEIPIPWTRPAYSGEEDADVHIILSAHNPMTPRSNAVSRRLSDLVIHPWAQKIQDAVRIILSPHNYLHNLPLHFELLKEPEQRIVQYLPLGTMVRTFSHPIKKDALQKCLFVGYAPKGDIDINRDLAILRSHVPNVFVLQNESATIENVIEKIHDSDLVYFACHGLFSRERLAAYLQVYDGQLSAGHILSSQGARAPKLVILNACYTGTAGRIYAQGDQMLSLHTAFLMKGVSYVLASLWTIGDRCAIKLAEYFLSSIFHKNLDVEHSYKDAVANISREGIWADPLEWAPFVLFGPSSIPE